MNPTALNSASGMHIVPAMTNTKALLLTLAITLSACGDGVDELDTPRSDIAAPLAGEWFTGTLSTIQYYNRDTGQFQDPSGSGFYYIFDDDGHYETGAVIDSTVAGCTMRLLGTERGTLTESGANLTVYRHVITTHVTNTCGNSGERTQGELTRSMTWSIARDTNGLEWLSLTHPDGSVEQYRRWTH